MSRRELRWIGAAPARGTRHTTFVGAETIGDVAEGLYLAQQAGLDIEVVLDQAHRVARLPAEHVP